MKTFSRKLIIIMTVTVLVTGLGFSCTSPSHPVTATISFSDSPMLNKPVKITASFTLTKRYFEQEANDVTAQIILPDGFEKIDGDLTWNGNLVPGVTRSLNATIKSTKLGTGKIEARADYDIPGAHLVGSKDLYVTVSEDNATISDRQPGGSFATALPYGSQTPNPHASPVETLHTPKPNGTLTIPTPSVPKQN